MQTGPGANLFLSKEDKFNIKMANTTITMLEMLKCTEIVNLASNNIIFTPETLRYFERNNMKHIVIKEKHKNSHLMHG